MCVLCKKLVNDNVYLYLKNTHTYNNFARYYGSHYNKDIDKKINKTKLFIAFTVTSGKAKAVYNVLCLLLLIRLTRIILNKSKYFKWVNISLFFEQKCNNNPKIVNY